MVGFTGSLKLRIFEAKELKPAAKSHWGVKLSVINPYLLVKVDDVQIYQTSSGTKTSTPVWNASCDANIENGHKLEFTVFHNSVMPPDPFIANSSVLFEEVMKTGLSEFWVKFTDMLDVLASDLCLTNSLSKSVSVHLLNLINVFSYRFPWNHMAKYM